MPLPLPEYADVLCKALWCFSFPKVTFDFRNSQRTQHENMRGVEECIGALLSHEDQVDVKDGLSNVLYWGSLLSHRLSNKGGLNLPCLVE